MCYSRLATTTDWWGTMSRAERHIRSDFISVGDLLSTKGPTYITPKNQRNFSWTMEEVEQLWNDLVLAMENNEPDYFLGTIVVQENHNEHTRTIIDGQQRLATLTMIFSAIRTAYADHKDDREADIYRDYLGTTDRLSKATEPLLTLNKVNESVFRKLVVEKCEDSALTEQERLKGSDKSNVNLAKAAKFLRAKVRDKTKTRTSYEKALYELEEFIAKEAGVILVRVTEASDAYLIFETVNDRGLDLSMSDLLKNYIFSKAGNQIDKVQEQWDQMVDRLRDQSLTQFLRHHWMSNYGMVRERDLYREMKQKFTHRNQVFDLMEQLTDAADQYLAILTVDHARWKGASTKLRRDLETLQMFGFSQFRLLMLAAFSKQLPLREIQKLVRMILVLSMRYNIVGGLVSNRLERAYSEAAIAIRDPSRGVDSAAKISELLRPVCPNDETFVQNFSSLEVTKPKLARYILRTLADETVPEDEADVNLEHIMPKTWSEEWSLFSKEDHKAYVDRLGNLTLIEAATNSATGNTSFQNKRRAFRTSKISMTKELAKHRSWTTSQIETRQSQLAERAKEVWPTP